MRRHFRAAYVSRFFSSRTLSYGAFCFSRDRRFITFFSDNLNRLPGVKGVFPPNLPGASASGLFGNVL